MALNGAGKTTIDLRRNMKLYDCQKGTKFKLLDTRFPPDYPKELVDILTKRIFILISLDGAYSRCVDNFGETHHPAAWSEVEIIKVGTEGELSPL